MRLLLYELLGDLGSVALTKLGRGTYQGKALGAAALERYAATGGWGYEDFRGDSATDRMIAADAATKCFAYHMNRKENDYVFGGYRK